ncbi:MAG: glutamate formimidoyltransferase [candidate division Zixibacteria bacterium]|nr:glutamate formimidoyltransferase [candidate division Zixibacteria bacterium]MDH3938880.1 glutamate formimidoyltransferase [candidate division Zixibacteria bacterium]MDH4033254.1 glutamate formimidoyltransferase [candidate division Zixibacteria bacterium]
MAKLIECVPNFSEGRRPEVIDAICEAITSADGVVLLDREMDPDHNRAVVTFVCHPSLAVEAAFRGYQKAAELIDMTTHQGEHPRMGACDVCPFIPISEVSIEEAVELANKLGRKVGDELSIPVFLYEDARTKPDRKNLAKVRTGQYEGMIDAIEKDPKRKPDYGPAKMNLKSGATAIGVRFPLVAFNVYLDTNKKWIADKVADAVRSLKGGYRFVKALGFEIKERDQVQISMNLVNFTKTPVFRVFETIKSEAARYGVNVTSSEIIGLVPNEAMLDVADFYLRLENFSAEQVLEHKLQQSGGGSSVKESFADEVASSSPAPGGGSVAAAAGALGAALASMVCRLSIGKKQFEAVKGELTKVRDQGDELRSELSTLVETDKEAFNKVMEAFKLPEGSERDEGVEKANKHAAEVPLTVMKKSLEALKLARVVAEKGNQNSITDAGVAALMARAAVHGAGYNVRINLTSIDDEKFVTKLKDEADVITSEAEGLAEQIRELVESKL